MNILPLVILALDSKMKRHEDFWDLRQEFAEASILSARVFCAVVIFQKSLNETPENAVVRARRYYSKLLGTEKIWVVQLE